MSIELADSTGNIGQAATNTGFLDASNSVKVIFDMNRAKELKKFFDKGYTKNPKQAAKDAMVASHKVKDNSVRTTLVNISKLLNKSKKFAVVQTG